MILIIIKNEIATLSEPKKIDFSLWLKDYFTLKHLDT
jgi:hypothetical protein